MIPINSARWSHKHAFSVPASRVLLTHLLRHWLTIENFYDYNKFRKWTTLLNCQTINKTKLFIISKKKSSSSIDYSHLIFFLRSSNAGMFNKSASEGRDFNSPNLHCSRSCWTACTSTSPASTWCKWVPSSARSPATPSPSASSSPSPPTRTRRWVSQASLS